QLADLAYLARHEPSTLSATDRSVMAEVAPVTAWARQGRSCLSTGPLRYYLIARRHLEPAVDAAAPRLNEAWRSVARRHAASVLRVRICRADQAWDPLDRGGRLNTLQTGG